MASSPEAGGPRHVGSVVDPLVLGEGETEPQVTLTDEANSVAPEKPGESLDSAGEQPVLEPAAPEIEGSLAAPAETEPAAPSALGPAPLADANATEGSDAIHPVKQRLLAKARALRQSETPRRSPGGLDELIREHPAPQSTLDLELDLVGKGRQRPPAAPLLRSSPRRISPNMLALFGGVLGLCIVASLVALVSQLDPKPALEATPGEDEAKAVAVEQAGAAAPVEVKRPERRKIPSPWRVRDSKDDAGVRVVEGKIGLNPFLRAIQDAGLEKKEAYRVLTALKDLKNLDKCERSDRFSALIQRSDKRVKAFEYIVSAEEVYQARENASGLLSGKKLDLKVERNQVEAGIGFGGGSLSEAAERAGLEKGFVQALAEALDGHMGVDEIKAGDSLRVVAQEVTVLGEFARYAGIEALEYRPKDSKESPLRLYYFRGASSRGHFDQKGRSPYEGGWRKPVKDAPITSHFNPKRLHPILKKVTPHTGTDFGAPAGTPVGASSYGTVSFIGPAGASGNLVKIEHPGGVETGYAHLSRFADGLSVGDKVKRLQLIGYVGSTGRSTGPHLHFTAKRDGAFFDAESLNLDGMRVLPKDERDAFERVKAKYDALLNAISVPAPSVAPEAVAAAETDDEPEERAAAAPEPAPAVRATPPEPAAPAKPGPPAKRSSGSSIYLTDKELLEMQGNSDDGEVSE